ncbi:MAG: DNA repair protein RadC [Bacillota bacterium]|nr:DNA repair protein RadC [Eubacteriales bacterium]MDI9491843.1 DNA repair protein RadC [Bacillota bacterium]NLV69668.1 DNA repair protein RadC [Clostridiales bacterium]HPF18974.1 DNA repair protein RadC [Bacillota bacterium]
MRTNSDKGPMLKELPRNELPREKILSRGVSDLSNAELIATLIASGTRKESALTLAGRVLALENGSLSRLTSCQPEEFQKIKGVGTAKSCMLVAAMELGRRIAASPGEVRIRLDTPEKVADLCMEEMRYRKKEIFRVALLNVKNELIMKEDISVGGLHSAAAHPREVFQTAIKKGANAVILIHNHPSGDPTPSQADRTTTSQLVNAGKILGIQVLDHVVIGDGRYVSFKQQQIL